MALPPGFLQSLAEQDLSPAEKRLRVLVALNKDEQFKAMPRERRRAIVKRALEYVGGATTNEPPEEPSLLEKAAETWKGAGDLLSTPSELLRKGVDTGLDVAEKVARGAAGTAAATPGFLYEHGANAAAQFDTELMGLVNALALGQLGKSDDFRGWQEHFQEQAEGGSWLDRLLGSAGVDVMALAAAPQGTAIEGIEGAAAGAKWLARMLRGARVGGGLTALHEAARSGEAGTEIDPARSAINVGLGTLLGGAADVGLGAVGDLASKITRPAKGSMPWHSAEALVRAGVNKLGKKRLLEARLGLKLPVVKGETYEQLRERIVQYLAAKERGLNPRPEDFGEDWVTKYAPKAEGKAIPGKAAVVVPEDAVTATTPEETAAVKATAAVPEPTAPAPSRVGASVKGGELKPPEFPVNVRVVSGGKKETAETILDLARKDSDELERIRANPTEADSQLVYESGEAGAALKEMQLHEPERVKTYAREIEKKIFDLDRQERLLRGQAESLPEGSPERLALDTERQKLWDEATKALRQRRVLTQFFGKGLKNLDNPEALLDAPPLKIIDAAVRRDYAKDPAVIKKWDALTRILDPEDHEAVMAAATAAKDVKIGEPGWAKHYMRKLGNLYQAFWYTNILSGVGSHIRNIGTNLTITPLFRAPERVIAGILSKATGKGDLASSDAVIGLTGLFDGMVRGIAAAGDVLAGRVPPEKLALISGRAKYSEEPLEELLERGLYAYQLPGPIALAAEDVAFKAMAFGQALRREAAQLLRQQGAKSPQEILKRMPEAMEKIARGDHPEILERAVKEAQYETFTDDPGWITERIKRLLTGTRLDPILRHAFPFIDVPSRIIAFGVERTPVGAVKAAMKLRKAAKLPAEDAQRAYNAAMDDFAKSILGTLYIAGAAMLNLAGKATGSLETYGVESEMARERKAQRQLGVAPKAVKIGDHWVSLRGGGPLDAMLTLGGAAADAVRAMDRGDGGKALGALLAGVRDMIGDAPTTSGFAMLSDAAHNRFDSLLKNLTAQHVPQSALMRGVERVVDPTYHETRSVSTRKAVASHAKSMIPGVAEKLPVRYDLWGQPMRMSSGPVARMIGPQQVTTERDDLVTQKIREAGYVPPELNPRRTMSKLYAKERFDLTPQEMEVLARNRRLAHDYLDAYFRAHPDLTKPEIYKVAETVVNKFNRKAIAEMMRIGSGSRRKALELLREALQHDLSAGREVAP